MRMPQAFSMIIDPLFLFFANDPRRAEIRLVNIISRLNKVPEFMQSYVRNLRSPIKRWVEMELEKISGLDHFFDSLLQWAESVSFAKLDLLTSSMNTAKASFRFYENYLRDVETSDYFFLGDNQMRQVIMSRGIDFSPNDLHTLAKDFLRENQKEVEILRTRLVQKYKLDQDLSAADLQQFLAQRFRVKNASKDFSDVIARYQREQDNILAWIGKRDLFPLPKAHSLSIIKTPRFMEATIPAGAMLSPLPLREGERKSIIYLTLREDLLQEHTELSIPNMMIHEGIPGHHLQLSWASLHPSKIRRLFPANDLAEGWTTMLEDYMLDCGYAGELRDEMRFSAKRDIARLGARVAIDLYFMSGDKKYLDVGVDCDTSSQDPFVAAGNLLESVTGFVPARIRGELNWYSQESGYPLSYLVGNQLMQKIKSRFFKRAARADFDFHQYILSLGMSPLSLIELSY